MRAASSNAAVVIADLDQARAAAGAIEAAGCQAIHLPVVADMWRLAAGKPLVQQA
jgi:hypothetical protein